jgi:hypothetical protein
MSDEQPSKKGGRKRKQSEQLTDPSPDITANQPEKKVGQKRSRVKSDTVSKTIVQDTPMNMHSTDPIEEPLANIPHKPEQITEEKLRNFILFKAFDIIGEGGYRRFVLKNKNNGEQWALSIYTDSQHTNRFLRSTLQLIGQLASNVPCVKLYKLCQRVTNDMNPPSISAHGWCICSLTGMRTENTTQLGRSNKGEVCYVHRKFHVFFTMLWFIARFELCIKYATIQWLQQNNVTPTQNIQKLCEKLQNDVSFTNNMCRSILHATQHVTDSVIMHVKRVGPGTMLNVVDPSVPVP